MDTPTSMDCLESLPDTCLCKCPACRGDGMVKALSKEYVECPYCEGTGEVYPHPSEHGAYVNPETLRAYYY